MSNKELKEAIPAQDEELAAEPASTTEPTEVIEVNAEEDRAATTSPGQEPSNYGDEYFDDDDDDDVVGVVNDDFSLGKTLGILALASLVIGASLFALTRLLRDDKST